jgi:hypothetical protein
VKHFAARSARRAIPSVFQEIGILNAQGDRFLGCLHCFPQRPTQAIQTRLPLSPNPKRLQRRGVRAVDPGYQA